MGGVRDERRVRAWEPIRGWGDDVLSERGGGSSEGKAGKGGLEFERLARSFGAGREGELEAGVLGFGDGREGTLDAVVTGWEGRRGEEGGGGEGVLGLVLGELWRSRRVELRWLLLRLLHLFVDKDAGLLRCAGGETL